MKSSTPAKNGKRATTPTGSFVIEIITTPRKKSIERIERHYLDAPFEVRLAGEESPTLTFTEFDIVPRATSLAIKKASSISGPGVFDQQSGLIRIQGRSPVGGAKGVVLEYLCYVSQDKSVVEICSEPFLLKIPGYPRGTQARVAIIAKLDGAAAKSVCDIKEGKVWDWYCDGGCTNTAKSCLIQRRNKGQGRWEDTDWTEIWNAEEGKEYRCRCL